MKLKNLIDVNVELACDFNSNDYVVPLKVARAFEAEFEKLVRYVRAYSKSHTEQRRAYQALAPETRARLEES